MLKLTDADFMRLVSFVKTNYGINLQKKRILIEGRLTNMLTEKGFTDYKSYLDHVFSEPTGKEIVALVNKLTTNHTFFLREPEHFEYLKTVVLPYIEQSVKDHDMRIWCAASSTGQEPYTLAMIIDEYFGDNAPLVVVEIELPSEDTEFAKPDWLGEEITSNGKFTNAYLSKHSYSSWEK